MSAGNDAGASVTIQPDGKIILAGAASDDFALARYNMDGTLDVSFGNGGKVVTPVGVAQDASRSVTFQADGKIILAGYARTGFSFDFALVRYNVDGTLDTSFGLGGKVLTGINGDDIAASVTIQPDGRIVVGGYSGSTPDFSLVRYLPNGLLDSSFGSGGRALTAIALNTYDAVGAVSLYDGGKILLAGTTLNSSFTNSEIALVRYNANGALDTTFGTSGKVTTAIIGMEGASSIAVQTDGKIIVAGWSGSQSNNLDFALVRYASNGSLDTSFSAAAERF